MSKNVTLRMDETLLKQLRHKAVDAHMSLSAWVVSTLAKTVEQDEVHNEARKQALKRLQTGLSLGGSPLNRDDIYDR